METRWLLADKYDLNQFNGAPEILNEVWSLRNKHYDQQCQRQRSSQVTQVEQHAENSFPSECR